VTSTSAGGNKSAGTPSILTSDLPTNDSNVGTMAGQAGTDGGAAVYSVPIVVPPGRAGMQPTLALSYNSRSGNGVMGLGWTISGVSSIHRCPQTPEQDSYALGVSYAGTDKLCLDGQRLVKAPGTSINYGLAGAEYRTEIDSYARIFQVGGGLTGSVTCFRVEQKDGRIYHYGDVVTGTTSLSCSGTSSANSRVQPSGITPTPTLSWQVRKIEDRVGNNQFYAYSVAPGNGENLLQTVTYTGFGTNAGDRVVTFNYEARTAAPVSCNTDPTKCASDISSSYLFGGLTIQTQALQCVTTQIGTTTTGCNTSQFIRTYMPTYAATQYNSRLIMTSLQECATDGTTACHPKTQFIYNDGTLYYSLNSLSGLALPTPDLGSAPDAAGNAYSVQVLADVDGDGTRETAVGVMQSSTFLMYLAQMTGDRAVQSAVDLTGYVTGDAHDFVDIDGDGRAELMRLPHTAGDDQHIGFNAWKLSRGTAASTAVTAGWTPAQNFAALFQTYVSNIPYTYNQAAPHGQSRSLFTADVNGDGKTDVIVVQPTTQCGANDSIGQQDGVFVYVNTTAGVLGSTQAPSASFTPPTAPLFCLTRTITGTLYHELSIDHIADFDGNGLPDFYLVYGGGDTQNGAFAGMRLTQNSGGTLSVSAKTCTDIGLVSDSAPGSMTDECNWQQNNFAVRWLDVNGDGLEDFVIARPNEGIWYVHLNKGGGTLDAAIKTTGSGSTAGLKNYSGVPSGSGLGFRYAMKLPPMDADGDGKPDLLVVSSANKFAQKMCTTIKVLQNADLTCPGVDGTAKQTSGSKPAAAPALQCFAYACPEDPDSSAGTMPANTNTPGYPIQWNGEPAKWMYGTGWGNDDNSVYHLAMVKFVQTGPSAIQANLVETTLVSRLALAGRVPPNADDLFGDGLPDLITPVGCTNQQLSINLGGTPPIIIYQNACSAVDDGTHGPSTFNGLASSTYATSIGLLGNINQGVASLGGSPASMSLNMQPARGTTTLKSQAAALLSPPILPGLLDSVVNGLGDSASWGYSTLSVPSAQNGIPLYTVPSTNGYADSGHYYFQSSMPVVFGMLQSDGIGGSGGFRGAIYGYDQAIYNHLGRGFQGFRTITSEYGGTDNRLIRTKTTYNQKFPLAGRVAEVDTIIPNVDGTVLKTARVEADTWRCTRTNRSTLCPGDQGTVLPVPTGTTVYQPFLDELLVTNYEPGTGTPTSTIDTLNAKTAAATNSGWDDYSDTNSCDTGSGVFGNLTDQVITRTDNATGVIFVDSHTTTTHTCYDVSGGATGSNWWINKLAKNTVASHIAYNATNHLLPSDATAPDQSVATSYTWNGDRTPEKKIVQPGVTNQQSTTTYCYPRATDSTTLQCKATSGATGTTTYGLPTQLLVCLGSLNGTGSCMGTQTNGDVLDALSPTRKTTYTYTKTGASDEADGYFVHTTTNALSQLTTTDVQPRDGQIVGSVDPNNIQIITTFDPFGRPLTIDHLGNDGSAIEPEIQIAYNSCLDTTKPVNSQTGYCVGTQAGEDSDAAFEAYAAYRVTTVQSGYPTRVTWYDLLQRSVKTAHAGFSGTFIGSLTTYDNMGTTSATTTPYFIGDSPYYTNWTYDSLNRPIKKVIDDSELTTAGGKLQTDYSYSGRQTTATAHDSGTSLSAGLLCPLNAGNTCLQTTHNTNVLGQSMRLTETPVLAGVRTVHTTDYWTEPQGHLAAIRDAEGNITTASYDALGHRTLSKDPDQQTWTFKYDALGEVLTQTDARGVVTTINQRDALGRMKEQQQVPPSPAPPGLYNYTELDDWSFDPTNGIGELGSIERRRTSGTAIPLQTDTPVWQESYTYDQHTARALTIATTVNEGATVTLNSLMDYDGSGRPNTHTYPSGLVVKNNYTTYGQLQSITNNGSTTYWTATAENEWDHVTGETFYGGTTGTHQDYHSTGQAYQLSWSGGSASDTFTYGYDTFANLVSQARTGTSNNTERYTYDPLQRLTAATRTAGGAVSYGYTKSGNLKYKSDFSLNSGTGTPAYSYAATNGTGNGCGPHAPYSVALLGNLTATYNCDANGNVIGGNTLNALFDADNHPTQITRAYLGSGPGDKIFCGGFDNGINTCPNPAGGGGMLWAYDSNGQRDYEYSPINGIRYYGPAGYERVSSTHKQELGPVIVTGTNTITVVLRDRLGSTLDVIDTGSQPVQRHYDAFGKARNGDMSDRTNGTLNLTPDTIHGFTSHVHEDDVALIHLGGRVLDPSLGKFLSVDPIAALADSQDLNPYSYLANRPLSGVDPTGYASVCGDGSTDCRAYQETVPAATMTGSNIPGYATGASVSFVNPSVAGAASVLATELGLKEITVTGLSNGSVSQTASGAGGAKNSQANAFDQMSLANAPNTQPGQHSTMTSDDDLGVMKDYGRAGPDPDKPLTDPVDDVLRLHPLIGGSQIVANCVSGGNCNAMAGVAAVVLPEVKAVAPALKELSPAVQSLLLTAARVPNAGGTLTSFVTGQESIFYRVYSGSNARGAFLTRVPPASRNMAVEGLALPPGNSANFIQEVVVPAGTRLQRSRALPAFGRRGGLEQFELMDKIPNANFREGVPFQ